MVWAKEIEVLQALTNIPPGTKSEEDLQYLVQELERAVEEARLNRLKQKELGKSKKLTNSDGTVEDAEPNWRGVATSTKLTDSDVDNSVESFQTPDSEPNEPAQPAQWPSPSSARRPRTRRNLWQNYLR